MVYLDRHGPPSDVAGAAAALTARLFDGEAPDAYCEG